MSHHNIPGARKRRDRRHGPRKPTGWTRAGDRWSHVDGRTLDRTPTGYWQSRDGFLWLYDPDWRTDTGHPGRFRELLPF